MKIGDTDQGVMVVTGKMAKQDGLCEGTSTYFLGFGEAGQGKSSQI